MSPHDAKQALEKHIQGSQILDSNTSATLFNYIRQLEESIHDPVTRIGPTWSDQISLEVTINDDKDSIDLNIEQSKSKVEIADMNFVTGSSVYAVTGLSPKSLDRIGDFCHRAADMIRKCSK